MHRFATARDRVQRREANSKRRWAMSREVNSSRSVARIAGYVTESEDDPG